MNGDDVPMQFIFTIDVDRQLIRLMSRLPFKMSEDKRVEGAIATCVASYGLVEGNFEYDILTGTIDFRMTASFRDSYVGDGLFQYMISRACVTVDEYNDKFLAIDKGMLSLNDFIAPET